MRNTDLKATVCAVIVALAVASGLVPTAMHSSQASHQGSVVAQSHRLLADGGPNNNPWD